MSREKKAIEYLDKMNNNESVSRWDIFLCRREVRKLVLSEAKYEDLYDEVESLIESAKESL